MNTYTFQYIRALCTRFIKDERGVTAIEYAIIAVAISAIVLAVFSDAGGVKAALTNAMTSISGNINAAN